ncbi:MAG: S-methyl-5-thioribose-1-phosphate isomerase, partial [Candidatus Hydrothermarchaeota archaeon]
REHRIPFYVAAPTSTIDLNIKSGEEIPIEYRDEKEIIYFNNKRIVAEGAEILNPAFDVTPAKYISAIITEKGLITPPYEENINKVVK